MDFPDRGSSALVNTDMRKMAKVSEMEYESEMLVKELVVPDKSEWEGMVREEELDEILKGDAPPAYYFKKTVIAMSKMEAINNWQTQQIVLLNSQLRKAEMERIQLKRVTSELKNETRETKWTLTFAKWAAVTIGSGAIAALLRALASALFGGHP